MKNLLIALLLIATPVILPSFVATPAWAVLPDEIMKDPVLEARARRISQGLRCLVCRNENIDDSNADLARDLRLLVRDRLRAGDTNQQVVAYIVARYGEYVLLKPRASGANLLLWGAGPLMLLLAGWIGFAFIRRRKGEESARLSADEQARLKEILQE